ncbi:MAG TPA: SDR family NAD(P)-dependent oxidoreductase, partial [Anaerolineales bacterium]|nr:SDR family NAD(P)-dependent oxidoreductase [Anaerolineales bacterium]
MMDNAYSLDRKLILVTGGGTGIGRGVALELARQGADVALSYASSAKGALEAVEEIQSIGRRAIAIKGNLSEVAECRRVVDEAAAFLGGLDGLVNNAGITATVDFLDVTEELFNRIYFTNIRGEYFCCQQAVPYILERGRTLQSQASEKPWAGGSIINMSSVHGAVGLAGHSVYAGTKGAINAFSRELAVELCPKHIRVNVLAPGSIEVPSYFTSDPTYTRAIGDSMVPWGRVGLPEDV